jgi:aspartate 1-decarboxylase
MSEILITRAVAKIHRATVTDADLNYEGSITIDKALLKATTIEPYERVQIVNCNNGERLETYVIEGEEGSGIICLNGAAARKCQKGDTVIIICYRHMTKDKSELWGGVKTTYPDKNNKPRIEP